MPGQIDIPEEFICPITQTVMTDPYVDTDGNSYEKDAILDWLRRKSISPITRNPMSVNNVFPNRTLRSIIENFKAQHPDYDFSEQRAKTIAESKHDLLTPQEIFRELGRKPLVLYAVIDVSGSMQNPCDNSQRFDATEAESFSRLDLVKHTLNTIISSLTQHDKICVIEFSTNASVFIKPTALTDANKETLMAKVNLLEPEGQTNIWDGMRVAIDEVAALQTALAYESKDSNIADDLNVHIYLLTDGEPTINPPGPIDTTIQNYITRKCTALTPTVSTFGYGYYLDSLMLYNIANIVPETTRSNSSLSSARARPPTGTFGFIPDASMVGTVFINALTNSLHQRVHGTSSDDHFTAATPYMAAFYDTLVHSLSQLVAANATPDQRASVLQFLLSQSQQTLEKHLVEESRNGASAEQNQLILAFLEGLLKDITPTEDNSLGQIHKAAQPQFASKWGIHYLRSVLTAFTTRQCINFKDQAMQVFQKCDNRLVEERQRIEDIFIALPAPKASIVGGDYYGASRYGGPAGGAGAGAAAAAAAPATTHVDMGRYYNVSGGCFTADSRVRLANGHLRAVVDLKIGDCVRSSKGSTDVVAVVRMPYSGPLYRVGDNMTLTAFHPITVDGRDFFPCELADTAAAHAANLPATHQLQSDATEVYDVVLRDRGLLMCPVYLSRPAGQDMAVATIGHDCQRAHFQHEYFGGEKMVRDLEQRFAHAKGEVWILGPRDRFLRGNDGRVCGLHFETQLPLPRVVN